MTLDGLMNLIKPETQDKIYQIGQISEKTGLQKTANGWRPPKTGTKSETPTVEGNKTVSKSSVNEESRRLMGKGNFRKALKTNPKGFWGGKAFEGTVTHTMPTSDKDREVLKDLRKYMGETGTDYKQALKNKAKQIVTENKSNGDWDPKKEQTIMKIAKTVGFEKELHSYIKKEMGGYDFGYSEDSATAPKTGNSAGTTAIVEKNLKPYPKILLRQLTGDCKITIKG